MSDEITPPELLAYDEPRIKGGNVRPADDRYLTASQKRKRDAHVGKVAEAVAEAEADREVVEDPMADVLQQAVDQALTASDPGSRPDVTPVTSPRGDDDQSTTGDDA
jgi:hypothetical protein